MQVRFFPPNDSGTTKIIGAVATSIILFLELCSSVTVRGALSVLFSFSPSYDSMLSWVKVGLRAFERPFRI